MALVSTNPRALSETQHPIYRIQKLKSGACSTSPQRLLGLHIRQCFRAADGSQDHAESERNGQGYGDAA